MWRILAWATAAIVTAAAIFVGYGSWQTYNTVDRLLTAGGPTAQNSGWPDPETPADIGFIGDPMEAYSLAFEDVVLASDLGGTPAWLVRPPTPEATGRWAIIVHGIGGRRENGYRFLPTFLAAGMPTMLISYRNDEAAPASLDLRYAFGLTEWQDLEAAAGFALANGASSIVLLGESMGGGIVGQFLRHSEHAPSVSAIVLDAAAIDFRTTLVSTMRQQDVPLAAAFAWGGLQIAAFRMPFDLRAADVRAEFQGYSGPMFISHGERDRIVPVALSDALVEKRSSPTEYLRTGADHILSWKEDPARYDAALLGFLRNLQ